MVNVCFLYNKVVELNQPSDLKHYSKSLLIIMINIHTNICFTGQSKSCTVSASRCPRNRTNYVLEPKDKTYLHFQLQTKVKDPRTSPNGYPQILVDPAKLLTIC